MFLAPHELFLRSAEYSVDVFALRSPRRIDDKIKATIRTITKLHVRQVIRDRYRETPSTEFAPRRRVAFRAQREITAVPLVVSGVAPWDRFTVQKRHQRVSVALRRRFQSEGVDERRQKVHVLSETRNRRAARASRIAP